MKKGNSIILSYNANIYIHKLKRIVGYYYKEYVELNEKFENMSEDEYSKMMIAEAEKAKTEKERDKITEEYAENAKKYYSSNISRSILTYKDQINRLDGYIGFKYEETDDKFELPLIDFISYDLNNINEYIVFFINNYNLVMDKLDKEDSDYIKLNTLYEVNTISSIAKKYYDKIVNEAKKMQTIFKICIDFVYQINLNEYTQKLSKGLTREQKFFVFNQINNKPFIEISNNFKTINSLDYTYEYIDTKVPELVISIIKAMDPEGTDISREYIYETDNLYTAFYIMLYNIISIKDWYVKICGNCGRYFITPKATVAYCDRIVEGKLACRDVGIKEQQKRKGEKEPVYKKYRQMYAQKAMTIKRNPDLPSYKTKYEKWKKEAKQFIKDIKDGKKTYNEFDEWLNTIK